MTSKSAHRLSFRSSSVVGISLLALALGGSTELLAQSIVILLAALLILVFPPRQSLGALPALLLVFIMGVALCAFLPVDWGYIPDWRRQLVDQLHVPLGNLRTPQPWLTLQACGLLFFGVIWTYYVLSLDWSPAEKAQALRLLLTGIVLLAAVSIVTYSSGYRLPGWTQEQNRGWFPNRNQTADVLAVSAIVAFAITYKRFQKKEPSAILWLIGLVILSVALVISYSRAGIIMFFCGIGIWQIAALFRPHSGRQAVLGLAALLFLLSLFLLFGGATVERFLNVPQPVNPYEDDYRILIQEDALKTSLHAPLIGIGLGNFEPVFTSMRSASADQNRTLHPESDWLWMAVEMGWIPLILILAGLRWWFSQCLPFALKSGESVRRAAMIAALAFLGHGFVDVSGHRLGSFMVGLFMAAVALAPKWRPPLRLEGKILFRALALVLILQASWWLASSWVGWGPPTSATLARIQTQIDQAAEDGRMASLFEASNSALKIAPLTWTYYFRRASAESFRSGATEDAKRDFQVARFLEPNWIDLCVNEGAVWLGAGQPDLCLEAWTEALRRAGSRGSPTYDLMLRLAQDHPEVHDGLKSLSQSNLDYQITFLNYATPEEISAMLDDLVTKDPDLQRLNSHQQERLFAAWYAHGNPDSLVSLLLTHSDLQAVGWKYLARNYAAQQNFELASLTALRFAPAPVLQQTSSLQSANLKKLSDDPTHDLASGILLCQAQIRDNQIDDALSTMVAVEKNKDCPSYIYYLQAQLYVKKEQWESAWNALLHSGCL